MEGKDGFQTFTEIKKKFSHLPIIFHSAYQYLKDPYDVMNEYRPFGYISKEGDPKKLLNTVVSAIEYNRQIRKNEILVDDLQSLNTTLEDKVTERTQELKTTLVRVEQQKVELNQALEQLEEKHIKLKQTQAQLVQSGKMASLGTVVAGVAHELNNPSNFVSSGAQNIERRLHELKKFIFQLAHNEEEIQKILEPKLAPLFENLSSVIEGSKRITNIIIDLLTFSRLDEAEQQKIDVEKNLKLTLGLVQSIYQDWVDFICFFDQVPLLKAWPTQLNQVFMNIIINSCQAIKTQQKRREEKIRGTLTIRISSQEEYLIIRFEDTGHGMSEEVKKQIFDPFFTTKEAGEGTGLGLSITYGIIEQHQGRIEVESELNKGTNITLFLPFAGISKE